MKWPDHDRVAWVSFEDREPPVDSAFDDPEVKTVRSVLVTNNICSKDRMGRHSHVWFAAPMKNSKGEWVAFTDSSRKIEFLTHWLDPFTTPPQRKPLTDERKDAARWAYIRKHWKTINFRFNKRPNTLSGFTLTISDKVNNDDAYLLEKEIDDAIEAAHSVKPI